MVLRSEVIPSELLRTFLLIEKTGSYTDAADILGLSQPAISSHMKRLQQMVGGELFVRNHGGFSLTSRGETVKHYATRILNLNWQMLRLCGVGEKKRTLRIGVPSVYAATHLMSMQQNFDRKLHDHRAVITWGRGAEIYDALKAGYLDAAYIVREAADDTKRNQHWDEKMCWVSSSGFVVGEGRPVPLLSWPNSLSDRLAIASLSESDTSYIVVLVAYDLTTHLSALRAGLGVCALPQRIVPKDLRTADHHCLPPLPIARSGVYVNEGLPQQEARLLREAIAEVMPPKAQYGPEAQGRLPEPALI
jgi:DNA-binding transcriptional LysR family regulator